MVADLLTKPLNPSVFIPFSYKLLNLSPSSIASHLTQPYRPPPRASPTTPPPPPISYPSFPYLLPHQHFFSS
jgi:hypothetical protein